MLEIIDVFDFIHVAWLCGRCLVRIAQADA